MSKIADLLPLARVGFAGALPDVVLTRALKRALQEFCRGTHILKGSCEEVVLDEGETEYDIVGADGERVEHLLSATYAGQPLRITTDVEIIAAGERTGSPRAVALNYAKQELMVWPTPMSGAGVIAVYAALSPAGDDVDDVIAETYEEALVAGAKANLLAMPGQPWTDLGQSQLQAQVFALAVSKARKKAYNSGGAILTFTSPKFN